jgi:hypothetical protein
MCPNPMAIRAHYFALRNLFFQLLETDSKAIDAFRDIELFVPEVVEVHYIWRIRLQAIRAGLRLHPVHQASPHPYCFVSVYLSLAEVHVPIQFVVLARVRILTFAAVRLQALTLLRKAFDIELTLAAAALFSVPGGTRTPSRLGRNQAICPIDIRKHSRLRLPLFEPNFLVRSVPSRIRTYYLPVRTGLLCPDELWKHTFDFPPRSKPTCFPPPEVEWVDVLADGIAFRKGKGRHPYLSRDFIGPERAHSHCVFLRHR